MAPTEALPTMAVAALAPAAAAAPTLSLVSSSSAATQPPPASSASSSTAPLPIQNPSQPATAHSTFSSLSSSPRHFSTDLTSSILEEGDETESEPPNEPVTPISGRQSQDFHTLANPDVSLDAAHATIAVDPKAAAFSAVQSGVAHASKQPLVVDTAVGAPQVDSDKRSPRTAGPTTPTAAPQSALAQEVTPVPFSKRSARGSTSSFKRSMSNIFKRSNSQTDKAAIAPPVPQVGFNPATSEVHLPESSVRKAPTRRFSMNRSSATTRSNSPPSPSSPLEMSLNPKGRPEQASTPTVPNQDAFIGKKKARAATGFSLRARVAFSSSSKNGKQPQQHQAPHLRRRASSFDYSKQKPPGPAADNHDAIHMERSLWGMPAETGTGVKARRMSLSLPDDFTVDVAELLDEFEYAHKLGRHGKHLGKGATSKVTLMYRKGCPGELYAVKEFRGRSSSETKDEYEKKIKSEYTVAKSLNHPNIVETIRLCTDRGRWNHVMEYCPDGDLFTLVQKKYLKSTPGASVDERKKDRQCLFKQLIHGIHYLHSHGIAHRDIKLENLLLTNDSQLKITDFGVCEVFSGMHPGLRDAGGRCGVSMGDEIRRCAPGICGSLPYIAPEVIQKNGEYDPRALDVWSSAVVMLNLIFGSCLWEKAEYNGENPPKYPGYAQLQRGWDRWMAKHPDGDMTLTEMDYPHMEAFDLCVEPPALRRVLLQMLHPNPERRITIAEVVKNRWVKGIECCQPESYDDPTTTIDASKKASLKCGGSKQFCHNHKPPREMNSHSLGKMPGSAGYF